MAALPGWGFAFGLVLARVGAAVMLLPGLGEAELPSVVRAGLAVALTALLLPGIGPAVPVPPADPLVGAGMVAAELVTGLWLGWLARLLVQALPIAGQIVSYMLGLSNVLQPDPVLGAQSTALARLLGLAAPVLLLASGLYALPIAALAGSYRLIAPGALLPSGDASESVVQGVAQAFALALRLAAPFVLASIVWQIALALLARLVPRLQVYRWRCRDRSSADWSSSRLSRRRCSAPGRKRCGRATRSFPASKRQPMAEGTEHEDRSEAATPRRLQKARAEGNVPISRELPAFAGLAAATLALMITLLPPRRTRHSGSAPSWRGGYAWDLSDGGAGALRLAALVVLRLAAPFVLATLLAGAGSVLLQSGFLLNPAALRPDLRRINPLAGLRRLASPESLVELGKSLAKVAVLGAAVWHAVEGSAKQLAAAPLWDLQTLLGRTLGEVVRVLPPCWPSKR